MKAVFIWSIQLDNKPKLLLYSYSVNVSARGMQCPGSCKAKVDRNQLWTWLDSDP